VAVILAVTVGTDLTTRATPTTRRSDLSGFTATIESDIGSCSAGLHDAVAAYRDSQSHKLSSSLARSYDKDGISACSFTNSGIVDLGGLQPPDSLSRLNLTDVAADVGNWAYLDGFTTLQDLGAIMDSGASSRLVGSFDAEAAATNHERQTIEGLVDTAQSSLGMQPAGIPLTVVGSL
jgi:hypothetical protein